MDMIRYKTEHGGIAIVFCDPRGTSKTCPRCGHATWSNRPNQGYFRSQSEKLKRIIYEQQHNNTSFLGEWLKR